MCKKKEFPFLPKIYFLLDKGNTDASYTYKYVARIKYLKAFFLGGGKGEFLLLLL